MEATENRNRTATRNDGAFETLMKSLDLGRIEFFYQFCNNPQCRDITMLVLPLNRKVNTVDIKVFSSIVRKSGIPGMILEYPKQDGDTVVMHAVTADKIIEKETTWQSVLSLMQSRQIAHETASNNKECANYTHEFMPKGNWKNKSQNYRFSNEVRSIPGVRHCDTDGILYCLDCCTPVFAVEATSDGCPGTHLWDKHKATTMTRKIGDRLGAQAVLLQHHVGDSRHENPAYLNAWGTIKQDRATYDWAGVTKWFTARTAQLHHC